MAPVPGERLRLANCWQHAHQTLREKPPPGTLVRPLETAAIRQHHREVSRALKESGIQEGLCLVNAMHISASVFINDEEAGLHHDFEVWLEKLAPEKPHSQYRHNGTEDNADAHLKRAIMGREVVVAITAGELDLGPWEQIFYGEFDGRRRKRVLIKIIGE
jgi:secondary thiamine-phosphate synthase enzyme